MFSSALCPILILKRGITPAELAHDWLLLLTAVGEQIQQCVLLQTSFLFQCLRWGHSYALWCAGGRYFPTLFACRKWRNLVVDRFWRHGLYENCFSVIHTVPEKNFERLRIYQGSLCMFHTKYIQSISTFILLFFFLIYTMQSKSVWDLVKHVTNMQYKLLFQQLGPRAV